MNRNSHNLRGSSVNPAPRWRIVLIALALVLSLGSVGQILPAQAAPAGATTLNFYMRAQKEMEGIVCKGDLVHISVSVFRKADDADELPLLNDQVTGVVVNGLVQNPTIGELSPNNNTTIWAGIIYPGSADFIFTAKNYGETKISFRGQVVTPGWFGSNYQGGAQAVSDFVNVQVIPCKYQVTTISNFSAQGVQLAAIMDGEMKADEQGNFTGSATVNWVGGVTVGYSACSGVIDVASSQADLTGNQDDSDRLTAQVTYLPAALTHTFDCGGSQTIQTEVTPDPLVASLATTGGVITQSQGLYEPTYYAMHGSVKIVVIPEEEEGVAVNPNSRAALSSSSWWAMLGEDNFPWLNSALLGLH